MQNQAVGFQKLQHAAQRSDSCPATTAREQGCGFTIFLPHHSTSLSLTTQSLPAVALRLRLQNIINLPKLKLELTASHPQTQTTQQLPPTFFCHIRASQGSYENNNQQWLPTSRKSRTSSCPSTTRLSTRTATAWRRCTATPACLPTNPPPSWALPPSPTS